MQPEILLMTPNAINPKKPLLQDFPGFGDIGVSLIWDAWRSTRLVNTNPTEGNDSELLSKYASSGKDALTCEPSILHVFPKASRHTAKTDEP